MSSQHAQQIEDLNFRVLRLLQNKPDASQREMATQLGVSQGKMNYCLNALIEKGLVKLSNFQNSRHKLKYVYLLTPVGLSEKAKLTGHFLQRKLAEYAELKAEIVSLKADAIKAGTRQTARTKTKLETIV
jgi:EPS-associated MarR family transcriptional regulator